MHADLASHAGLTAFGQTISDRIRAESHDEVEALLRSALGDYPSPAADLALALAASSVRVAGWSALNARIEALSASTKPITAIWLHLSNYTDDAADGLRHPAVEIGYLRDGDVAFSREALDRFTPLQKFGIVAEYPVRLFYLPKPQAATDASAA